MKQTNKQSTKSKNPQQNNENSITFLKLGFQYSESLALDHSTGNVFFAAVMTPGQVTSTGQDFIRVIHRKLLLQKTLLENLDRPRSIALFSSKGFVC